MEIKIQTKEISETFKVPDFRLDSFLTKIKTLQNKFKKHNLEELKVSVGFGFQEKIYIPKLEREVEMTFFNIQVSGLTFHISGYKLLALMSKRDDKIELSYGSPDFKLAHAENLPEKISCERCQKVRHRVHFAMLEEESTGRSVILGKECADDFYDKNIVRKYLFTETLMSLHEDANDDFGDYLGMPKYSTFYAVEIFLAHSIETFIKDGFHPKAELERSSVERAKALYSSSQPKTEHLIMASEFLADPKKAISLRRLGNDSIRFNIMQAIKEPYVEEKYLAFLVLMAPVLLNLNDQDEEGKEIPKPKDAGFFGTIDEKVTLNIEITGKHAQASNYHRGDDYTIYAQSSDGHKLVIPGNSFYPAIGAHLRVKGVVKSHFLADGWGNESFPGKKSMTKLIRVKTLECEMTKKFVAQLIDLFEDTKVRNRDEYYDLYYQVNDLANKYDCISMAVTMHSYEDLVEGRKTDPINCATFRNTYSSYDFTLDDHFRIKVKEHGPGVFTFVVTRK